MPIPTPATPATPKTTIIEYAVYIHLPANQNNRFWERASVTQDAQLALEQAQMLYGSQKYPKVEVKRKFFCSKRQKSVAQTLHIFDEQYENAALWMKLWMTFKRKYLVAI